MEQTSTSCCCFGIAIDSPSKFMSQPCPGQKRESMLRGLHTADILATFAKAARLSGRYIFLLSLPPILWEKHLTQGIRTHCWSLISRTNSAPAPKPARRIVLDTPLSLCDLRQLQILIRISSVRKESLSLGQGRNKSWQKANAPFFWGLVLVLLVCPHAAVSHWLQIFWLDLCGVCQALLNECSWYLLRCRCAGFRVSWEFHGLDVLLERERERERENSHATVQLRMPATVAALLNVFTNLFL